MNEVLALAWRRNPEESFSDWTIHVKELQTRNDDEDHYLLNTKPSAPNNEETTAEAAADSTEDRAKETATKSGLINAVYHVHRVYLASGPRKSDYFKTLFSTQVQTAETSTQTTQLELPKSACIAFPAFLDYIYGGSQFLPSHPSVALLYLADYLQVQSLIPIVTNSIRDSITASNIHWYCREGLLYNFDWIIQKCMNLAALSPQYLLLQDVSSAVASTSPTNGENEWVPPAAAASSVSLGSDGQRQSTSPAATTTWSPAQQVMEMLPSQLQIQLLQVSLKESVDELQRFKRLPSQWKDNIDDLEATHLPQLLQKSYPAQGSGIPFPNKVCPLFYYDAKGNNNQSQDDDSDSVSSRSRRMLAFQRQFSSAMSANLQQALSHISSNDVDPPPFEMNPRVRAYQEEGNRALIRAFNPDADMED